MKLSRIIFLGGLSSLALCGFVFWQRSNAVVPVQQSRLVAAPVLPSPVPSPIAVAPAPAALASPIASTVPAFQPTAIAPSNLRTIAACNNQPANANFRAVPSLAASAVLGVVARGQRVALTGKTAVGDGLIWYEAIAPSPLYLSTNPAAINQVESGQTGWIAACFVGE